MFEKDRWRRVDLKAPWEGDGFNISIPEKKVVIQVDPYDTRFCGYSCAYLKTERGIPLAGRRSIKTYCCGLFKRNLVPVGARGTRKPRYPLRCKGCLSITKGAELI
jgi:hypothetical protein